METYNQIKDSLTKIQSIIDGLKERIYQGRPENAVDIRIYDSVIEAYFALGHEADQIKNRIDRILLCKNDSERLDFFLMNVFRPHQFDDDII